MRSLVGASDFLVACAAIPECSDPKVRAALAGLLGFDLERAAAPTEPPPIVPPPEPNVRSPPPLESAPPPMRNEAWVYREPALPPPPPSIEWFAIGEPLAELAQAEPPPVETLFLPRTARELLHALLGGVSEEGEVDIDRLVEIAAEYGPIARLPRRRRLGLKGPVRILIDVSDVMRVFAADQDDLLERARRLLPREALEVGWFDGSPEQLELERKTSLHPAPGTSVVVVSDLGLSAFGRARTEEWIDFADRIVRHGSSLIVLSPIDEAIAPRALARRIILIPWARRTTAGLIRRARSTK